MEGILTQWAVAVVVAMLFGTAVSMLLPESGIKKYVAVVVGIVVTIVILSPLVKLLGGGDVPDELKKSFGEAGGMKAFEYDGEEYKDYIYDLYQVYMVNDQNKNE